MATINVYIIKCLCYSILIVYKRTNLGQAHFKIKVTLRNVFRAVALRDIERNYGERKVLFCGKAQVKCFPLFLFYHRFRRGFLIYQTWPYATGRGTIPRLFDVEIKQLPCAKVITQGRSNYIA